MTVEKISVSLLPDVVQKIIERGETKSTIINRDLDRLYTLYVRALSSINLTVREACLIVDALNGSIFDANTACLLWANIEDSINIYKLDIKWNIDGRELVKKLKALTDLEAMAVVDAAEKFWEGLHEGDIEEGVRKAFNIRE